MECLYKINNYYEFIKRFQKEADKVFKNSFEELLFLRFLSKNAEHQRKMNQKMLKTQQELARLQRDESLETQSVKKPKTNKNTEKTGESFDLAARIEDFKSVEKNKYLEPKRKNVLLSILLTLTLGPFGLFYSTKKYAGIMIIIFVIAVIIRIDYTIFWFIINTTIVSIGIYKTLKWNKDLGMREMNEF